MKNKIERDKKGMEMKKIERGDNQDEKVSENGKKSKSKEKQGENEKN